MLLTNFIYLLSLILMLFFFKVIFICFKGSGERKNFPPADSLPTWHSFISSDNARSCLVYCFLRFIYLLQRQRYREQGRDGKTGTDLPSTFTPQIAIARSLEFHPDSHVVGRYPSTWAKGYCFPNCLARSWSGSGAARIGNFHVIGCLQFRWWLTLLCHNAGYI